MFVSFKCLEVTGGGLQLKEVGLEAISQPERRSLQAASREAGPGCGPSCRWAGPVESGEADLGEHSLWLVICKASELDHAE